MNFGDFFKATSGHSQGPFDYQARLAGDAECRSRLIEVPTGLGKTAAVILAWLWNRVALNRPDWPRRLVYCLPMRTLVEQTQQEIEQWLRNLNGRAEELGLDAEARQAVQWLLEHSPVVLMGGEELEPEKAAWDLYPERPCILIGTQDMLLSRALNRGYGMSRYRWPMHFGLLNNDALWVMDEIQLMGPGLWTSAQLDWMRQKRFGTIQPCQTWWMSATVGTDFLETPDRVKSKMHQPEVVALGDDTKQTRLLEARRPCEIWTAPTAAPVKRKAKHAGPARSATSEPEFLGALAAAIIHEHKPGTLSLIVCNTVKTAQAIFRQLDTKQTNGGEVILLTSRFRPADRNKQTEKLLRYEKARKAALRGEALPEACGLICVCTQIIEAGVDVSARRLWSEFAPWPSLTQRCGRLNRDGSDNGEAKAFFFEMQVVSSKQKGGSAIGPYPADAVQAGKLLMEKLAETCRAKPDIGAAAAIARLRKNETLREKMNAALQPPLAPFPRAIDVHGLFSTEPDLFGGFTDVSQFVRGEDRNGDVTVFWRDFDPKKRLAFSGELTGPAFSREEGCAVAVHRLREFLGEGGLGWVWEPKAERWGSLRASDICPGMTVMLPASAGGYDTRLGWVGERKPEHPPENVPIPGSFEDELKTDPASQSGVWVELGDHLADAERKAKAVLSELQLPDLLSESVYAAASQHDIGKALNQWQEALPSPAPATGKVWAKAPFVFAVRVKQASAVATKIGPLLALAHIGCRRLPDWDERNGAKVLRWLTSAKVVDWQEHKPKSAILALPGVEAMWMVQFRPKLRHEAATALALWHQYFREGASFPALSIYLAAAHHGKVRTVLTSQNNNGDDVCGISRHTDSLPWNGERKLAFECASDGAAGEFSADGTVFVCQSPGWTNLVTDLLGSWEESGVEPQNAAIRPCEPSGLGPFALAYLETLVRCIDHRASRNPSIMRHV